MYLRLARLEHTENSIHLTHYQIGFKAVLQLLKPIAIQVKHHLHGQQNQDL